MALEDKALEPSAEKLMRKTSKKKRRAPDPDIALKEEILDISHGDTVNGVQIDDNEPTIAEKLATIEPRSHEHYERSGKRELFETTTSSLDYVQVLLKRGSPS
ncbi:hypothetical protein Dimus_036371 [Dionaea muscipula]